METCFELAVGIPEWELVQKWLAIDHQSLSCLTHYGGKWSFSQVQFEGCVWNNMYF